VEFESGTITIVPRVIIILMARLFVRFDRGAVVGRANAVRPCSNDAPHSTLRRPRLIRRQASVPARRSGVRSCPHLEQVLCQ
jgi:hypothetical protein